MKINLDSLPLISLIFFGFLLINTSLKLHYKNISIPNHKHTTTPFETFDLFAIFASGLALLKLTTYSP